MMLFGMVRKPTMRDVITAIKLPRLPLNLAVESAVLADRGAASLVANMSLPLDTSVFRAGILLQFIVARVFKFDSARYHARARFLLTDY